MVCMSPSYTYKFIDVVTTEYNMPVFEWSNALKEIFTEVRLMFYKCLKIMHRCFTDG